MNKPNVLDLRTAENSFRKDIDFLPLQNYWSRESIHLIDILTFEDYNMFVYYKPIAKKYYAVNLPSFTFSSESDLWDYIEEKDIYEVYPLERLMITYEPK